ncbi:MAG TPA: hypothetical protein VGR72_11960 [Candidatus Acidoferrales bacterium]|nr:hypothetical protein [Candidatus Acidoferrales bacterium]
MRIGEIHSWDDLHHIHCVARSFYTGAKLAPEAIGSMLVLPAKVRSHYEGFDYGDFSFAQTMLLRLEDTAIIVVFDDSQASQSFWVEKLNRIDGPLSPLQLREIVAEFAAINIHLAERPRFSSDIDLISEEYEIIGHRPTHWYLENWKPEIRGGIMHHICKDMVVNTPDREQILSNIRTGRYTFLVDEDGKFLRNHMDLAPMM